MRAMLILAAAGEVAWLVLLLARYPARRVGLPVVFYLLCLAFQALFIGILMHRGSEVLSREYALAYEWTSLALMVAELGLVGLYVSSRNDWLVLAAMLGAAAVLILGVARRLPVHPLPEMFRWVLVATIIEGACGVTLLFLAASPRGDVETVLLVGLGLYWIVDALYKFALVAGRLNPYLGRIESYQSIPTVLAMVVMALLIFQLYRGQGELARQGTNQAMQQERTLVEG